jgi:hypothetical protein
MTIRYARAAGLAALTLLLSACAAGALPPKPTDLQPIKPPQNMLGSTDDLGLVADVALQMADRYGNDKVLVILDLDNTLLAMEQDLGSDQWFYWQYGLEANEPCSPLLVGNLLEAQGALFHASAMRPTQPNAAAQVRRMQDEGLRVIILTARGPEFRLSTFRELRRNGFSFWSSALPPQSGFPESFIPEGGERPVLYEDGVFLTAGQNKGVMLKALLKKTGQPDPTLIIMADDKDSNLREMQNSFSWSGTAVHGWRFTGEDARVKAFDPPAAATQWEALRPALMQIEEVLGSDNFSLPPQATREGCGAG